LTLEISQAREYLDWNTPPQFKFVRSGELVFAAIWKHDRKHLWQLVSQMVGPVLRVSFYMAADASPPLRRSRSGTLASAAI